MIITYNQIALTGNYGKIEVEFFEQRKTIGNCEEMILFDTKYSGTSERRQVFHLFRQSSQSIYRNFSVEVGEIERFDVR
jgi:hypothetical protein